MSYKILVVGAGSIGTRHLKNLLALGYKNLAVCEPDEKKLNAVRSADWRIGNFALYKNIKTALKTETPDVVFVCNPTHLHVPTASLALDYGAHVFIEKPLSHNLNGVDALIKKAKAKKRTVMVACNYRFHPGFQMLENFVQKKSFGKALAARIVVGHDLAASRAGVDYRKTYAANPKQGGGVVFDSGSHVVEYLSALFGKILKTKGQYGNVSDLKIKSEDYAAFSLNHVSGVVSSVELDYFSKPKRHNIGVQFDNGWARWDFPGNTVECYDSKKDVKKKMVLYKNSESYDARNDMYLKETRHFMEAVKQKKAPLQDLRSAGDIVKILSSFKNNKNKI